MYSGATLRNFGKNRLLRLLIFASLSSKTKIVIFLSLLLALIFLAALFVLENHTRELVVGMHQQVQNAQPFSSAQIESLVNKHTQKSAASILFILVLVVAAMYFSRRLLLISRLNSSIDALAEADRNTEMFRSVVEYSRSLVVIFDQNWAPQYINSHFTDFTGFSLQDLKQQPEFAALLGSKSFLRDSVADIKRSLLDEGSWRGEYRAYRKDGTSFWVQQIISELGKDSSGLRNFSCAGRDVSDVKAQQKEMEKLAYYDVLTGISNRGLFKEQLGVTLRRSDRDGNQSALLYLDLDHFKRINDTMGHEAGDLLLVEVASRLTGCLRDEDIVGRLGGDEFGVLLSRIGSPQYASIVANKLLSELSKPISLKGTEVTVSSSIGITVAPHDGNQIDLLMKNADMAMYQAKEKGRNNFRFYTADMNRLLESRMEMEHDLREAVKHQQFSLHYQPQVDLITGEIVGAEALIRWQHPSKGNIGPIDFIPIAEETGLIVPIGKWVLRTAAQQIKCVQKALKLDLKISVNLSARQLSQGDFVQFLSSVLDEFRLSPELLELEVTESLLMDNIDNVIDQLSEIRSLGVSLAIDDFGTGYSSLSYLKQLPVDILKIDRSFVKDLPNNSDDREITSLIITLAKKLNRKVIAEGVETKGQIEFLRENGCDYGQGYYYAKPLPADEFLVALFNWDNKHGEQ